MSTPKTTKTLVIKINQDVTQMGDAQITALKAFYTATYEAVGIELSYELLINDEAEQALDLYQRIQQEFKPASLPTSPTTGQPGSTAKKSGSPFGDLGKLFGELGKLLNEGDDKR